MKINRFETIPPPISGLEKDLDPTLRYVREIAESGLSEVVLEGGFIMASSRLFRHPFGRDSAISAEKLLPYSDEIARQSILLMVALQGVRGDEKTEEEPGKIFHEMKVRGSDPEQQAVFDHVSKELGIGDGERFVSYTSVDATLEFIHLVARYIKINGRDLLMTEVNRQGEVVTIEQAVKDAVQWLRDNIAQSDIGLVGAYRTNPKGVIVPDLLDGAASFMHENGDLINYSKEVNTINFQSLGYQALIDAAKTATSLASSDEREAWLREAEELKQNTLRYFSINDGNQIAMALDRDESGNVRQLATKSILPAVALRTGIFDDKPEVVKSIFEGLYDEDMMTSVGPRTQALDPKTMQPRFGYTRYQDPPWPVLVGRVVEGATRYREYDIALDLAVRMVKGVAYTGAAEEFHIVTGDNKICRYVESADKSQIVIKTTNTPESPQAWTAASVWQIANETIPYLVSRDQANSGQENIIGKNIDLTINRSIELIDCYVDKAAGAAIEAEITRVAREKYEK